MGLGKVSREVLLDEGSAVWLYGENGSVWTPIAVTATGKIKTVGQMVNVDYDSVYFTYPTDTTDVMTFKLLGATVAVVTITYTDNTKATMLSSVLS